MKLTDPVLLRRLAGEYVLGTLAGAARRRFERALQSDPAVRAAVAQWEQRLLPHALKAPPVAPDPRTWRAVEARLGLAAPARAPRRRFVPLPLALAAAVALLAVGISWWVREQPAEFRPAAVVATTDGRPLWRVELAAGGSAIRVAVTGRIETPDGKDFELWALPEHGAPVSLGLLPAAGHVQHALGARQRQALAAARQVAVSVEPRGGSPTGAPTGPVVHVAPLTLAAAAAPPGATAG